MMHIIKKMSAWNKLRLLYIIAVSIIFISFFIIINRINDSALILVFKSGNSLDFKAIAVILSIIGYLCALFYLDYFFDLIPIKRRIKLGQNITRWKSKEFDDFAGDDLIDLYLDSYNLLSIARTYQDNELFDYSFVVLPAAKAYEGILKKILVNTGLITESILLEKPELSLNRFFNPVGNESIFNSLKDKARDKAVPHIIYATYQECRNVILHYDSYRNNTITLEDADFYIRRIDDAIEKAYNAFKSTI